MDKSNMVHDGNFISYNNHIGEFSKNKGEINEVLGDEGYK